MKTIILLVTVILTYVQGFATIDIQDLKKGSCVVKTINANDTHVYKLQLEAGTFVSVFLTENNVMLSGNIKMTNNNTIKEFLHCEGSDDLSVLSFFPERTGEYTIELTPLNFSGQGKYCIDFKVEISKAEKQIKDQQFDVSVFENYYFAFDLDQDRTISVGPSLDLLALGKLTYYDNRNNRFGILHPLTDSTFYSPYSMYDKYSNDIKVTLHKNGGKINSVSWTENNQTKKVGLDQGFRNEKVTFMSGEVRLKGMLMLPEGNGPFPAVVMTQSNASPTRHQGFFISYLLSQGIAVLSFDKRGTGESDGNWIKSSFADLKNDINEGMNFLSNQEMIERNNIGVFSISQGGLISSGNLERASKAKSSGKASYDNSIFAESNDLRKMTIFNDQAFRKTTLSYYDYVDEASIGMPYNYNNNFF